MRVNSKTFQASALPLADWETPRKSFNLSLASVFLIWKMGAMMVMTYFTGWSECSAKHTVYKAKGVQTSQACGGRGAVV